MKKPFNRLDFQPVKSFKFRSDASLNIKDKRRPSERNKILDKSAYKSPLVKMAVYNIRFFFYIN